jgi:hypothetical protein
MKSSHVDIRYKTHIDNYLDYDDALEYVEALKALVEKSKHIVEGVYDLQQFKLPKTLYDGNTLILDNIENIHTIINQLNQLKPINNATIHTNISISEPFNLFIKDLEFGSSLNEFKVYNNKHFKETTVDYVKRNYAFYYISSVLVESIDNYISKQTQLIEYNAKKQKAQRNLIFFNIIPVFITLFVVMNLTSKIFVTYFNPNSITFWSFAWRWLLIFFSGFGAGTLLFYLINHISKDKKIGTLTYLIAMAVQIVGSYFLFFDKNAMAYPPWIYFIITVAIALFVYAFAIYFINNNSNNQSLSGYTMVLIPTLGCLITMGALYQTSLLYSIMVLVFPFALSATILIIVVIIYGIWDYYYWY